MRKTPGWKSGLLLVAGTAFAALNLVPLRAQDTAPFRSTPEQRALLNKIAGVGSLKFGTGLDAFDKGELKSTDSAQNTSPMQHFIYTPGEQITWGTLLPTAIELQFYYNQLTGIRLGFNETNATLISVYQAFFQKYGSTQYNANIFLGQQNGSSAIYNGPQWQGTGIKVTVCLPESVPPQAPETYLDDKSGGAVELIDVDLQTRLTRERQDVMRNELLKGQDLDKIKTDL